MAAEKRSEAEEEGKGVESREMKEQRMWRGAVEGGKEEGASDCNYHLCCSLSLHATRVLGEKISQKHFHPQGPLKSPTHIPNQFNFLFYLLNFGIQKHIDTMILSLVQDPPAILSSLFRKPMATDEHV